MVIRFCPRRWRRRSDPSGSEPVGVQAWPRGRDYNIAPEIYSIVRSGRWDIIHCQCCHTLVPPLAMFAARKANIPYVVTFHTGVVTGIMRRIQWEVLRPLLVRASMIIGVSRFEADYFRTLLHTPASKVAVIPNGADLPNQRDVLSKTTTQPFIVCIYGAKAPCSGTTVTAICVRCRRSA